MSDIFAEVEADLRRDRWQAIWDRYGLLVIGGAVSIVLLVAIVVGYRAYQQSQNEAASLRYEDLLQQMGEADSAAQFKLLSAFARREANGYGVLADFGAARVAAKNADFTAALAGFDALAARSDLTRSMRDYARLQAAIVLVNQKANADDIAARLVRLFDEGNALRPIARDILALAYLTKDAPLKARELYSEQLADPDATPFSKQRAQIMLSEVEAKLRPSAQAE